MNLVKDGIKTIIWATGYRPDYSWLELPVLDRKGRIIHDGGIVCSPGVYLMGMQFLRRRKSALIDGAGDDARDLSAHLAAYLDNSHPNSGPITAKVRRISSKLARRPSSMRVKGRCGENPHVSSQPRMCVLESARSM